MPCLLTYNLSVTGDCGNNNSGAFSLDIVGSAPNYSITWVSPYFDIVTPITTPYNYTVTNLSAGTYTFTITDSCNLPTPNELTVNVYISNGTCASIINTVDTTCGYDNGSLTAKTSNFYGEAKFYLYELTEGYIDSAYTLSDAYEFTNLYSGIYYVIADDGGGCSGKSESCIIKNVSLLDFDFYKINNAGCAEDNGALYVTGLTGIPPYTYVWSDSSTGTTLTGLTEGLYSLTVTDSVGCSVSKTTFIEKVPPVEFSHFIVEGPSCLQSNGEVTVVINGGTPPYYYLGSNGASVISFGEVYTFTGLSSGLFTVAVTDAGLCNFQESINLVSPSSFDVLSVSVVNAFCNSSCNTGNGSITVNLVGPPSTYTYTLTNTNGDITENVTSSKNVKFNALASDTYTLTVSSSAPSPCVFNGTYVVDNDIPFTVSAQTTGITCNELYGFATVSISSGGTAPYTYDIGDDVVIVTTTAYTFSSLTEGSYVATVTDANSCQNTFPFTITSTSTLDFTLAGVNPTIGNNGSISALITNGIPPLTLNWSSNVNGQTGITVSNLSAGTYSLTITGDDGCVKTVTTTLNGANNVLAYELFNICESEFQNTGETGVKSPEEMLLEGFYDLTSGDTNCILNEAIFYAQVTINGVTITQPFFTGNTLSEYPTVQEWAEVLEYIISSYSEVGNVEINTENNEVSLTTSCSGESGLEDNNVIINLLITYDISCECCGEIKQFQNGDDFNFMNGDDYLFQG
jgi:hypothetical protein